MRRKPPTEFHKYDGYYKYLLRSTLLPFYVQSVYDLATTPFAPAQLFLRALDKYNISKDEKEKVRNIRFYMPLLFNHKKANRRPRIIYRDKYNFVTITLIERRKDRC